MCSAIKNWQSHGLKYNIQIKSEMKGEFSLLEEMKKVIQNSSLDEIYLTGFVDFEENELSEFVPNSDYLIFEFGKQLIKIQSVEQYSKISISKVNSIQIDIELEDVKPAKSRISGIIFHNPLIDNKIVDIEFYNLKVNSTELLCDAMGFTLSNDQIIFIDPSFLGINIGDLKVKKIWENNLSEDYISDTTLIKFTNN